MDEESLLDIFTYHPPTPEQRETYEEINKHFQHVAMVMNRLLPNGPGKETAIRKLSDARMQCNACVALGGKF